MPGLSNETWSVRLTDEETGAAFFAALTNRNSLLVRMPYEKNGGAGVRTVEVHAEEFVILVARSVFHIEDTPRPAPAASCRRPWRTP